MQHYEISEKIQIYLNFIKTTAMNTRPFVATVDACATAAAAAISYQFRQSPSLNVESTIALAVAFAITIAL